MQTYIKNWEIFNENEKIVRELTAIDDSEELFDFLFKYRFKSNYDLNNEIGDIDLVNVIGGGEYGIVYEFNGYVYKLTFDKVSYLLARKLIGKKYKHLVDILDVEVMHNKVSSLYLIKMDKCTPLVPELQEFIEAINIKGIIKSKFDVDIINIAYLAEVSHNCIQYLIKNKAHNHLLMHNKLLLIL